MADVRRVAHSLALTGLIAFAGCREAPHSTGEELQAQAIADAEAKGDEIVAIMKSQFPIIPEDRKIVDDAVSRSGVASSAAQMSEHVAIVIDFGQRRCVVLRPILPSTHDQPAYCYRSSDGSFVSAYENQWQLHAE